MLAEILETSAAGYAALAASAFFDRRLEPSGPPSPSELAHWRTHHTQRVLELAAAVDAEDPGVFAECIAWVRKAFLARALSEEDLRLSLRCLAEILDAELPEDLRDTACRYLDEGLAVLQGPAPEVEGALDPKRPADRLALSYLATTLEGDPAGGVRMLLAAVEDGLEPETAYVEVLLPAQREVGRLWHQGQLSIAEERVVTETTRRAMAALAARPRTAAAVGRTVVAAAVEGNAHDLPVRAMADLFEISGWRAICLGGGVPGEEVARAAQYFGADVVALSVALPAQLKRVRQTIEAIRRLGAGDMRVIVGGNAFADAPDRWRRFGADGWAANIRGAIEEALRLVTRDSTE